MYYYSSPSIRYVPLFVSIYKFMVSCDFLLVILESSY